VTAARGSLVFLKLGGSLLGDKRRPRSFRRAVVARVAREILAALGQRPGTRLLLAHGGGAPAHHPAQRYRTRQGLAGGGGWRGFAETRRGVADMNRRVVDALERSGLSPVTVPPSAGALAEDGAVVRWDLTVIRELLAQGRIPLIHGDVLLDRRRGFTVSSTEELFAYLARPLRPARIVVACDVEGVYVNGLRPVGVVDRHNVEAVLRVLRRRPDPRRPDVTGGMAGKVERLFEIARDMPRLEVRIVSGLKPGRIQAALAGESAGTVIRY